MFVGASKLATRARLGLVPNIEYTQKNHVTYISNLKLVACVSYLHYIIESVIILP